MEKNSFEVKGTFKIGDDWKPYTKVIEATNEAQAREQTLAVFGSKHRLKRKDITIASVSTVRGE
jgi:large subunit ribosomal protein LX